MMNYTKKKGEQKFKKKTNLYRNMIKSKQIKKEKAEA